MNDEPVSGRPAVRLSGRGTFTTPSIKRLLIRRVRINYGRVRFPVYWAEWIPIGINGRFPDEARGRGSDTLYSYTIFYTYSRVFFDLFDKWLRGMASRNYMND